MGLIGRYGRLQSGIENFNYARKESLKGFHDFVPSNWSSGITREKNSAFQNFIGQIGFIKNSFKTTGGHLEANGLGYIRIPKSASTSMSQEMLERKYPSLKGKAINERQVNFLADVNIVNEIKASEMFTIVRNPFARIVSVYRDFFENKNTPFLYSDYLFGILSQNISFGEFINRIAVIPDRLKDQHIRPQHTFLRFYKEKSVQVKVFKLEEPQLSTFLSSRSLQLPHLNKSKEDYDYRSYYDLTILNKVLELYTRDIHDFGYEKELLHLQNYLKTVH